MNTYLQYLHIWITVDGRLYCEAYTLQSFIIEFAYYPASLLEQTVLRGYYSYSLGQTSDIFIRLNHPLEPSELEHKINRVLKNDFRCNWMFKNWRKVTLKGYTRLGKRTAA